MSTTVQIAIGTVVVLGGLYLIGASLVDTYFKKKAEFVDDLYEKTKGSNDGKNE